MANAVNAMLKGHDYQALIFWLQACDLLREGTGVVRVAYEFDSPKAFDDVVVWYDPGLPMAGPDRVKVRYIQSKFKVTYGQEFGAADLADPAFINAESHSLLQRLRDAQRAKAPDGGRGARFMVWTLARLSSSDFLHKYIDGTDKSIRVDELLDGSTDRSDAGRLIRKPWRKDLDLDTDEELRPILYPLELNHSALSLMDMRERLSYAVAQVGLKPVDMTVSDCRYCSAIHSLNGRKLNDFDRDAFIEACKDERLLAGTPRPPRNDITRVSIRSFLDPGIDPKLGHDKVLLLTRHYKARYISKDDGWREAIQPEVTDFLNGVAAEGMPVEVTIDAHSSIAFLSGHVLHPKRGIPVTLMQRSAGQGTRPWKAEGLVPDGAPRLEFTEEVVGTGEDVALCVGISQSPLDDVRRHVSANLPEVGHILSGLPEGGPSFTAVKDGAHASAMADAVAARLSALRGEVGWGGHLHVYLAVPNGLAFMIGQRSRGFGPATLYEFDFERRDRGYRPSMTINGDVT